jgi:hypothetical protein
VKAAHQGERGRAGFLAQDFQDGYAVDFRHHQVEQDRRRLQRLVDRVELLMVERDADLEAGRLRDAAHEFGRRRLVVDHQRALALCAP